VVYNQTVLQSNKKNIDTCGSVMVLHVGFDRRFFRRYVALRIRMKALPLADFLKLMQSGPMNSDMISTALTLLP
jgi:hypothetical protein